MAKAKKIDQIKAHLKSGKSLTQLECIGLYGAYRLAARVEELRKKGWPISTEIRRDPNGDPYGVYTLEDTPRNGLPNSMLPEWAQV